MSVPVSVMQGMTPQAATGAPQRTHAPGVADGSDAAKPSDAAVVEREKLVLARRRRLKMIAAFIFGCVMLYLLSRVLRSARKKDDGDGKGLQGEDQGKSRGGMTGRFMEYMGWRKRPASSRVVLPGARPQGPIVLPPLPIVPPPGYESVDRAAAPAPPPVSAAEKRALAKRLKAAGFELMGNSRCSRTARQRDLFGRRDGDKDEQDGRLALESMYKECVTAGDCPGIKGYPTWKRKDQFFPGFQSQERIGKLVEETEQGRFDKAEVQEIVEAPAASKPPAPVKRLNLTRGRLVTRIEGAPNKLVPRHGPRR